MKCIIGKTEVNAWKIVNERYDSDTATFYLTLDDGTEVARPVTHGQRVKSGDYFVQGQPVVTRTGHVAYSSPAVPSIVSARDFVNTYTPIPELAASALQTESEPAPEPAPEPEYSPAKVAELKEFCGRCGQPRSEKCGDDYIPSTVS